MCVCVCVGQMGVSAVDSSQLHPSSNTVHQRETVSVTFSRAVTSLRQELEVVASTAPPHLGCTISLVPEVDKTVGFGACCR